MSVTTHTASPDHEVLYQDLAKLITKHAEKINEKEMLAIAANMLGKLIAMQDQRTMSREVAMEIVVLNIEKGNEQVIQGLARGLLGGKH